MDTSNFTQQDLDYINSDAFDKTQDIYAYCPRKPIMCFPTKYTIYCNNLPTGAYHIAGSHIDFNTPTIWKLSYGKEKGLKPHYDTSKDKGLGFIIYNPTAFGINVVCSNVEKYIKELRKQAIENKYKLEQSNNMGL